MTKFLINDCHTNKIENRRIVFNRQIDSVINHQSKSANRKWIAIALVTFLVISIGLFALITNQFSLPEIAPPTSEDSLTYNHEELVNYALVLINNDRQKKWINKCYFECN